MEKEFPLWHAIQVGVVLGRLQKEPTTQGEVVNSVVQLQSSLKVCELPNALAATKRFTTTVEHCSRAPTGGIGNDIIYDCRNVASIVESLLSGPEGTVNVVKLQRTLVSENLLGLEKQLTLTDSQKRIRDEAVRCIECGAYRSGIVMSWNLIYDYIRSWIAKEPTRQQQFDSELQKRTKAKHPHERTVLGILRNLPGVNQDAVDGLIQRLNQRNRYAHARRDATLSMANAYADELIEIAVEHFGG